MCSYFAIKVIILILAILVDYIIYIYNVGLVYNVLILLFWI